MGIFFKKLLISFFLHFIFIFLVLIIYLEFFGECPSYILEGTPERGLCEMDLYSNVIISFLGSFIISLVASLLISSYIFFRVERIIINLVIVFLLLGVYYVIFYVFLGDSWVIEGVIRGFLIPYMLFLLVFFVFEALIIEFYLFFKK